MEEMGPNGHGSCPYARSTGSALNADYYSTCPTFIDEATHVAMSSVGHARPSTRRELRTSAS